MMIDWNSLQAMVVDANVTAFGSPVVYTPAGGSPVNMQAIYDEPNFREDSALPSHLGLQFRAIDFTSLPNEGDTVAVGAATYRLYGIVVTQSGEVNVKMHRIT